MSDSLILLQPSSIAQVDSDLQMVELWLHSEGRRSERTREEYRRDIARFEEQMLPRGGFRSATVQMLIDYQRTIQHFSSSTQARYIASVKSLLAFGHKIGYLPIDVGQVVSLPIIENKLSERILSEEDLFRILALETNPRNLLLLKVFYVSAGRVSETVALQWRNLQSRESGGQITFFGKGGKTRVVLIPEKVWSEIQSLGLHPDDDPVFKSQKGSQLSKSQAWRIVRAAAVRAGIARSVSPHWFRHAHISHALDNGAPMNLVKETAGHSSLQTTSRYAHARPNESSSSYLKIK